MIHRLLVLLALSLFLPACAGPRGGSGGGGVDDDDDSAVGDDDDSVVGDDDDDDDDDDVAPESNCDDGIDDDADGLIDCEDSDCDAAPECNYPVALNVTVTLDYEASFLAEIAGYSSCITSISSPMFPLAGNSCVACDEVYAGPYSYPQDSCPVDPADPRPTEGNFGLVFIDDSNWEVFGDDGTGNYASIGLATDNGAGTYILSRVDPVPDDGGDLTTTITFFEPIPD